MDAEGRAAMGRSKGRNDCLQEVTCECKVMRHGFDKYDVEECGQRRGSGK